MDRLFNLISSNNDAHLKQIEALKQENAKLKKANERMEKQTAAMDQELDSNEDDLQKTNNMLTTMQERCSNYAETITELRNKVEFYENERQRILELFEKENAALDSPQSSSSSSSSSSSDAPSEAPSPAPIADAPTPAPRVKREREESEEQQQQELPKPKKKKKSKKYVVLSECTNEELEKHYDNATRKLEKKRKMKHKNLKLYEENVNKAKREMFERGMLICLFKGADKPYMMIHPDHASTEEKRDQLAWDLVELKSNDLTEQQRKDHQTNIKTIRQSLSTTPSAQC